MPGMARFGQSREVNSILYLQRMIGDQAVSRQLQGTGSDVAATPRLGHDFSQIPVYQKDHGQVLDRDADQLIHMPGTGCRSEGHTSPGYGEPLAGITRARLESILGTRLGDVRIHRGPAAERAAAAVGALAFTVGQDIVLGTAACEATLQTAQGSPNRMPTRQSQGLLAHEAAHTVQQSGAVRPPLGRLAELPPYSLPVGSLLGPRAHLCHRLRPAAPRSDRPTPPRWDSSGLRPARRSRSPRRHLPHCRPRRSSGLRISGPSS
jgi:hypothetical protein